MNHPKSLAADPRSPAPLRQRRDPGPNYMLLAFGILVALALPYLLRPRVRAFPTAGPPAAGIQPSSGGLFASPR